MKIVHRIGVASAAAALLVVGLTGSAQAFQKCVALDAGGGNQWAYVLNFSSAAEDADNFNPPATQKDFYFPWAVHGHRVRTGFGTGAGPSETWVPVSGTLNVYIENVDGPGKVEAKLSLVEGVDLQAFPPSYAVTQAHYSFGSAPSALASTFTRIELTSAPGVNTFAGTPAPPTDPGSAGYIADCLRP
jgi:hypothetical protein